MNEGQGGWPGSTQREGVVGHRPHARDEAGESVDLGEARRVCGGRIEVHGRLRAVIEQAPAEGLTKLRAVRRVVSSP